MERLVSPAELRKQARRLEQAAKKLTEAADVLEGVPTASAASNGSSLGRSNKVNELVALLKVGPKTAAELMQAMNAPRGSLYTWLRDKERFVSEGGKWRLKDPLEQL